VPRHSKNRVGQFKLIARAVQAHVTGKFNAQFFEIQSVQNLKNLKHEKVAKFHQLFNAVSFSSF
jgi:hypothetical protein